MKRKIDEPTDTLTRRDWLKKMGGGSLSLAAAAALSPFVLSGCPKKGANEDEEDEEKEEEGPDLPESDKIKVGIMHSLTGVMAISEKSLRDAEVMAIEEINAAGGVLDKKIEAVITDPASNFDTGFPNMAKKLIQDDKVAAVFGCWTSSSRKSVLKTFERTGALLFYPVQYEGNECSKNVVYTGAAPNQQIIPAIDYLYKTMKKRKFYLLGSNYIFPQTANKIITAQLKNKYKIKPVAEKYAEMTEKDFSTFVDEIVKAKPDVIFSTINGNSNIPFYNELASKGITAKDIPVCAVSVAEDELRALKSDKFIGHLAAWNYFQSIDSEKNKEFVQRFKKKYGKKRVTDDPIEAAYFQVYLWKLAVEKARSIKVSKVRKALRDLSFDAPEGKVTVSAKNQHTWKAFRMGRILEDGQFEILENSVTDPIEPDPYPRIAYNETCDWTAKKKKK